MARRLQIAGVGLCAIMFPACMSNGGPKDPYYTGSGSGIVLMERQGGGPLAYRKIVPDPTATTVNNANPIVADPKYAPIDPVQRTLPADQQSSYLNPPNAITITEIPPKNLPRISVDSPLTAPGIPTSAIERPIGGPLVTSPFSEPTRFPEWPLIGGRRIVETPIGKTPELLPKLEPVVEPSLTPMNPSPAIAPTGGVPVTEVVQPPIPAQPMNVSMKLPEPTGLPIASAATPMVAASNNETLLVQAVKAFQLNRPEEAVEALKKLDPINQELLMSLMPLIVRLGEGNINAMPPEETAILIDRLQAATEMLKSKAALGAEHVCFCRGVRKFADVDPYEPRHEFRPGDMVFLYAELKNFTCEPLMNARAANAPIQKGFAIRLGATLEIRDARNALVWRTDLTKIDFAQTSPHDYYHTYRFCVPEKLPAGAYTLWLTIVDKPTGRIVRKPVEMRVGQS